LTLCCLIRALRVSMSLAAAARIASCKCRQNRTEQAQVCVVRRLAE
jgi:hypothetical protein